MDVKLNKCHNAEKVPLDQGNANIGIIIKETTTGKQDAQDVLISFLCPGEICKLSKKQKRGEHYL